MLLSCALVGQPDGKPPTPARFCVWPARGIHRRRRFARFEKNYAAIGGQEAGQDANRILGDLVAEAAKKLQPARAGYRAAGAPKKV